MAGRWLILVGGLVACGGKKDAPPAASSAPAPLVVPAKAHDPALETWRQAVAPAFADEQAALAAFDQGADEDDAAFAGRLHDQVLPRYQAFARALADHPPPEPYATLHRELVVLVKAELAALERTQAAVAAADGNAVLEANREQRRISEAIDALMQRWDALEAGKH